jgi:hypothetical protein
VIFRKQRLSDSDFYESKGKNRGSGGALLETKINPNCLKIHFRTMQNTHTLSLSLFLSLFEENVKSLNLNLTAHKATIGF